MFKLLEILKDRFGKQQPANELAEVCTILDHEDFADFVFSMTEKEVNNQFVRLKAEGLYNSSKVGFIIAIDRRDARFVTVESMGQQSDRFLLALSQFYQIGAEAPVMNKQTRFLAFALEGSLARVKQDPVKLKLFYEDEHDDEAYAEFYLNFDYKHNRVELMEKDPEYRSQVFGSFTRNNN